MKLKTAGMAALVAMLTIAIAGLAFQTYKTVKGWPSVGRDGNVVIVDEDYTGSVDVRPGDRLHVIMTPDGDPLARCMHMGGTYFPESNVCQDVDF